MRISTVVVGLLSIIGQALALPPPEFERVLVVFDETNSDVDVASIVDPLQTRGFQVTTAGVKEHPRLHEYDARLVDNVVIVPGRVKALGSTLRAADIMKFMTLGGNVVALSTPKYNPATVRDVAKQLGIEVSGRGVQYQENFGQEPHSLHGFLDLPPSSLQKAAEKSAVAKLSDENPLLLGLVQAPYTAYAWNAAKEKSDDGEVAGVYTPVFGEGSDLFLAAALQSKYNSRFVWVGSPQLLMDESASQQITQWAFHETGYLRLAGVSHTDANNESHLHYSVEQDIEYCADIEEWDPQLPGWRAYRNIEDVQLEFKMLNPYYRVNLQSNGCVSFKAPEQYGMFTFQLDYQRPGYSFVEDKQVVTVKHRANNEWDRSYSIANSWVYLSGIAVTVAGFVIFVLLYIFTGDADMAPKQPVATKTEEKEPQAEKDGEVPVSTPKKGSAEKKPRVTKRK